MIDNEQNYNDKRTYDTIRGMVLDILNKEGLLLGQWHLGKVESVLSPTKLKVFVDGGTTAQTISCNPDIIFAINDYVWVIFINGNPRDKFVLAKRAI